MGWQNIVEIFYGVALPDEKADVVYGLYQRYTSRRIHVREGVAWSVSRLKLPGDVDVKLSRERAAPPLVMPSEEQDGRRWIGVRFSMLHDGLPAELQRQIYPITDPTVASFVKGHHEPSTYAVRQARPVWNHFAGWCKRRGVDLPPASICVVADYD